MMTAFLWGMLNATCPILNGILELSLRLYGCFHVKWIEGRWQSSACLLDVDGPCSYPVTRTQVGCEFEHKLSLGLDPGSPISASHE